MLLFTPNTCSLRLTLIAALQVLSRGRGYACFLDDVDAMNVIPVGRVDMEAAYLRLLLEKFWEWEVKVEKDGVAALRGRDVGYRLRHLERGLVRVCCDSKL